MSCLEKNRPARAALDAGDGADQRGLAGAVRADDGDDLALADLEAHVVEGLGVAVIEIEIADRKHQIFVSSPR